MLTVWIERSVLEAGGLDKKGAQSRPGHPRRDWLGTGLGINSFQPFRPVTGQIYDHADTQKTML